MVLKPGNEHIGAFGCDSYDISGTTLMEEDLKVLCMV